MAAESKWSPAIGFIPAMSETLHLHPTAPLAGRVLLPGDPGRALLLAQSLLAEPRMFNHNRGLWGYTGVAADGEQLTIQSTGMGGPSAAIVISELAQLGARTMLRVGTCGALAQSLSLGELLIADAALVADGASAALGAPERVGASPELVSALQTAAGPGAHTATVVSTDLFYDPGQREQGWRAAGASAVEMETAVLFTLAGVHGIRSGSVLIVSDLILPERRRIAADALTAAEHRLGDLAATALSALPVL
ncbi:MAG: purine-nucleoside phosphorylase [Solirubrobacteraceae bacterium]|jgi:uridine phosphorylase|nr:purine-nucleoside phosphorylase [Solirubrobacteraceae bacterium]